MIDLLSQTLCEWSIYMRHRVQTHFLILIASRPPAAPQGFRDFGLFDFKFTIEALKKTRAKTQTQTQKHTNSSRSASEWHLKDR